MTPSSPNSNSAGRTVLVTGATRGIGRAIAVAFGARGAHVIAVGRTQGALESLDDEIQRAGGQRATLVAMDLRQPDGIDQLGGAIFQRHGSLDVLIAAAGLLGVTTPVAHLDPKVWDEVMAVNLTSNYRLIRSMDPLLQAAPAGRAIFLTSGAASGRHPFWGAYAASKAGLEALVATYRNEVSDTAVRVAVVNPGPMRTKMRALAFPGEDPATLPAPEAITPLIAELADPGREPPVDVVDFPAWQAANPATR